MSNPFDQFDAPVADNPFDKFDAKPAPAPAGAIRKVADLGVSALRGAIAVPEAAVGLADIVTGGRAGKALEEGIGGIGFRPKEAKEIASGWYSDDYKAKQRAFEDADGVLDKTVAAVTNPSLIVNAAVESAPQMLAGGAIARGVRAAAPLVGAVGAGAIGEGVVGAGSAAEQIRQETADGLLTAKQAALAGASGAATGLIGAASGKVANKLGIGDVDTMLAGGTTAVANQGVAKGAVRRAAEGFVNEGFLEELPQGIAEQGLQNYALDRPFSEGQAGNAVMGVLTGGVMGAGAGVLGHSAPRPAARVAAPAAPVEPAGPITRAAAVALNMGIQPLPVVDPETGESSSHKLGDAPAAVADTPAAAPSATPISDTLQRPGDGQVVQNAGAVPAEPDAEPLKRVQVGPNADSFTNVNAQGNRDLADRAGMTQAIEDLFAEGKTVKQAGLQLEKEGRLNFIPVEDRSSFLIGVRATLGIPSRGDADGEGEFQKWAAERTAAKEEAKGAKAPGKKPSDAPAPAPKPTATPARATYDSIESATAYVREQRANGSNITAAPLVGKDGTITLALKGTPEYETALDQRRVRFAAEKGTNKKAPDGPIDAVSPVAGRTAAGGSDNAGGSVAPVLGGRGGPSDAGKPGAADGAGAPGRAVPSGKPSPALVAQREKRQKAIAEANAVEKAAAAPATVKDSSTVAPPAVAPAPAVDIKAVTAKQIPDMTDAELVQATQHHGPEHKRTAKLQKEITRRATNTTTAAPEGTAETPAPATRETAPATSSPEAKTQRIVKADPARLFVRSDFGTNEPTESLKLADGKKPTPLANIEVHAHDGGFSAGYGFNLSAEGSGHPARRDASFPTRDAAVKAAADELRKYASRVMGRAGASVIDKAKAKQILDWLDKTSPTTAAAAPSATPSSPSAAPAPAVSANKVFTEDAAAKARARLKSKIGRPQSGIDPEMLMDGITLAGYHIEKGARTFAAYARAMLADLGDGAKPFLKSWYLGVKFDPRGAFEGMDSASAVEVADLANIATEPAAPDTDEAPKDGNATRKLDGASPSPLDGAPATEVPASPEDGQARAGADPGGDRDGGGDSRADDAGRVVGGGVGGNPRAVPVSARGTRANAKNEKDAGVSGARGADAGPGESGDAGGRLGGLNPADGANHAPNAPPIAAPQIKADDFTIEDDFALGEGGQKTKFKGNVAAIRLLNELESSGRLATPDEQQVLAKYVGWGGLPQAFDAANAEWSKEHAELTALLSAEDLAAARKSTRYAHYTSRPIIVDGIYAALRRFGFTGGKTLEAGAGVGNFMGLMPADMRSAGRFTAVEREPFSSAIAKHLYPQQNVQRADFTEFKGTDAFYDAAVGNPPFAADPQTDRSGRKHLSGLSLHNYFFAKNVDMLREGGLMAQVVTSSFLDAKTDTARKYISDRTRFLGAIRMPNNAFAKNANTEVTTDIIFLQKLGDAEIGGRAARADAKRWIDLVTFTDKNGRELPVNRYFSDNPHMMLGDFGAFGTMYGPDKPALVARAGQDTLALLKDAVSRLPENVYKSAAEQGTADVTAAAIIALKSPPVQEGGFFMDGDKLIQRQPDLGGEARGVEITPASQWTAKTSLGDAGFAKIKALSSMRTTLRGLLAAEMADDDRGMGELRAKLNQQYDAYAAEHGLINDPGTLKVFDDDPDFPLLASLEHGYTPGIGMAAAKRQGIKMTKSTAKKSPIFDRRVVAARSQVAKVETPADALQVSMAERGKLDTTYIGELLGLEPEAVLTALSTGDKPQLFRDPATDEFVLRDAYLSGNVRAKLAQAKAAGMFDNIAALEKVQPEDVSAGQISARIGSPWVPEAVYADFAKMLFGEGTEAHVHYVKLNSSFRIHVKPGNQVAMDNTWGTKSVSGEDILSALLNNRPIKVTFRDEKGKTHVNVEATDAANNKAGEIRDRFQDWIFADGERADVLVRAYNDTNNNYVTREFDGSRMTFPGKVPNEIIKFRKHQRNAIARIVQDRTALLDHVVGSGKTFTIVAGSMELKRTGLSNKPMVAVPNHLVKQWAADFYRLYPGANILTATKKDFEKANRRKFLAKIATGDWDAVVIAHSSFGFIQPAPEFETAFNEKQIEAIMAEIKQVEDDGGEKQAKRRTVKQLEALKEKLENRIKSLRDKPMDDLLDFQQLGVDQLFVDEAHMFKNLMFSTKMQGVQGLGDAAGSQRAYDMYVKVSQIYEQNGRGQGVVFATGTPVSNSLAEMYHMMRYLMPAQMEELGFTSFDAWANTFASVEQVWMQKPSGDGFKASNRMSNFVNTPELLKMFDQVSDTVTMDDIQAAYRDENDGAEFPLPKLKTGRRQPVSLEKSPAQEAYMAEIAKRALAVEQRKGPPKKGEDNVLVIMGDARKAAMDIRLVDPTVTEREIGGRVDRAADEALARYKKYDKWKGTQVIFSDLGTPLKHAKAELKEYEALQASIEAGSEDVKASAALGNESAIGIMEDAEAAQAELDGKGADWLGAVQAALRGFSVYDDMRAALVERGIPEAEIAFIHDYNTDDQKAALFRKVNSGQIRFLVGSTAKMGAGTNVQERLVAEHHLDVPWRPSDVEQREGRIIRQGNKLMDEIDGFEVEILAYVTRDTLDMRMWQVQETKLKMINQLRTRKISREIDNAFEDMELSAGEMQAAATGNMDLLTEIQLRTDIKKLEQRRRSYDAGRNELVSRKKRNAEKLERLPAEVVEAEAVAVPARAYVQSLEAAEEKFTINIDGTDYSDREQARTYLRGLVDARVPVAEGEEGEQELMVVNGQQFVKGAASKTKAAPLNVTINGEEIKSRARAVEAYSEAAGDAAPIRWTIGGIEYNRRTAIATAIRSKVMDAMADETLQQIGEIGDFKVAVEGSVERDGNRLEVTMRLDGKVVLSNDFNAPSSNGAPEFVARVAENQITSAISRARYLKDDLRNAEKEKHDLDATPEQGEWPDQPKLDGVRTKHKEVLTRLNSKDPAAAAAAAAATVADQAPTPGAQPEGGADTGEVAFRRQPRAFSPAARAQATNAVEQRVREITANWANAPEIVVAFDMGDPVIPERVRKIDLQQRSGGAGAPEGFYYRGKAYLMASKLTTQADTDRVLFHEVLGHAGLRGVFGDSLNTVLQQVALFRREEVTAKMKDYGLRGVRAMDRLTAAEEVLAEMAQATPTIGFVVRAVAAVRTWLREHVPGFERLRLTDAEIIRSYILPARGFVERGGPDGGGPGGGTAFSRAAQDLRPASNFLQARVAASQFQGKPLTNAATGMVATMTRNSLDKMLSRKAVDKSSSAADQALAVANIDTLFRDAIVGWSKPDNSGDVNVKAIHRLFAPLQTPDGVRLVKLTVKELARADQGNRIYTVESVDLNEKSPAAQWVDSTVRDDGLDPTSIRSAGEVRTLAENIERFNATGIEAPPTETDSSAFEAWFADSKVVTADGAPLRVYHGTQADFSTFDIEFADEGDWGTGFYFTDRPDAASNYAKGEGGNVMPVYLRIENPATNKVLLSQRVQDVLDDGMGFEEISEVLADMGHDGIAFTHKGGGVEYVVFKPEQIKSAIGNAGAFSNDDADVRFSRDGGQGTTALRARALDAANIAFNTPGATSWWHKTVGTPYTLAQKHPSFKRVFDSVQSFLGDVSKFATAAADLAPKILPKLETIADMAKQPISAADSKAIAAPIFEGTLVWARDEDGKPVRVADLEEKYAGLDDEAKGQLLLSRRFVTEQQLKNWQGLPIESYEGAIDNAFNEHFLKPGIVFRPAELKSLFNLTGERDPSTRLYDGQIGLYHEFRDAIDKSVSQLGVSDMVRFAGKDAEGIRDMVMDAPDHDTAMVLLRDHLLELGREQPARAELLRDTADKIVMKADAIDSLIKKGYAPLSRFGQFSVDVVDADGERVYFGLFESKHEAAKMVKQMGANYPDATVTQGTMSQDAYKLFAGVTPETLELFGSALGLESDGDSAMDQAMQEFLKRTKTNRSAMKRLIHRKGIAGFSEDPGRVLAGFVYSNARQASANLHNGETKEAVAAVPKEAGQLRDIAINYADYVNNPHEEAAGLRGLLFTQYIGGSIASALVNFTQPIQTTFPYLSQFGGVAKAANQVRRAAADALKHQTGDADLDRALKHAEETGVVSPQEVHHLMAQAQGRASMGSGDGTLLGDARAMAGNYLAKFQLGWGKLFSTAEQFNRRVTFIAAYRTAVAQKIDNPAAFAAKAIAETQFIANKGNRPTWARGAIGATLFTFKSYSVNYVELLARMATAGEPGSPERAAGQRAAMVALAMLFMMGGAGGLPFADDMGDLADALMQRLGYNWNTKQQRQALFESVFGKAGGQFIDRGISGLPGVPLDVSGRLGMGNLLPGTGLLTVKADHSRDVAELFGPAGDLAKRTGEAAGALVDGKPGAAAFGLAPKAIGNLRQGYDMATSGFYKDMKGRKVVDTDGYDAAIKMIGFQPNDVAKVQEAKGAALNAIAQNRLRSTQISDMWAEGIARKDKALIDEAREDLARWNANNPSSPITINMSGVIKKARTLNTPADQRTAAHAPKAMRQGVREMMSEGQ
ncbi:PLxRFG domain-containing protein [Variovorax boronicumulans]|uniref:PLxRFG domain-containing protein n=1 Tax=Variovorax boronicumulans TaxID=436515 RepID=UPI0012E58D85|nr:PLxRFG domain-containing protein [Variovorax boronicumulans]GER16668.1 hypothetical protein VCH24_16740 [Variovorax boronicumulans]